MKITLPDGSIKEYAGTVTPLEVAGSISEGLARAAVAAKINGKLADLHATITEDCKLAIITKRDAEHITVLRHTASHVLAQAIKRLYPGTKLAIGPAIDKGFYYDFDFEKPVSAEDMDKIEKEMSKISAENFTLQRFTLPKAEAIEKMAAAGEPYKVELIEELPEGAEISFYTQGEFTDLCAGPHMPSTGAVKHFKILSITGAYWRGSEKNKMLTRIYATAFEKKQELEEYLVQLEEAKKRDHNKLGRELELFTTVDYIGQGLPILLPKGARIVQLLQRFVEDEEEKRGYLLTKTPLMAKSDLYKMSGHWDHYYDSMFVLGDKEKDEAGEEVLALRPMTCPFQFQVFLNRTRSYRDLPMRLAETSTLFRNESSGEMHGLIRVRQFTISEAHLILTEEHVEEEFKSVLDLIRFMLETLGLEDDVTYRFSKWDPANKEKYIGSAEAWENTQAFMKRILDHLAIQYTEADGEAAFYGPKLDIQAKNVHGKEDTIITVQIDFQLAERFDMTYIDKDGQPKHPIIIHRTSIGCYERTLALLIEKYAGAFPLWLAPEQVRILNITDRVLDTCDQLLKKLRSAGIRAELDDRNEKIGYKIREAQMEKIPYMLVIGDKEAAEGKVAVRSRKTGDMGIMAFEDFLAKIQEEIIAKAI